MEPESSFVARPYYIAANLGFPAGAGLRAGASIIPELGVDLHVGSILLLQDYGADLVVRPLARSHNWSPTVRIGMSALQSNLTALGGPAWLPMPSATVGVEWRTQGGFVLGGDIGGSLIINSQQQDLPTTAKLAPNFNLSIGYAF
jgi:hypothetical protein